MANYRIGSRGSEVEELQRLLNQNGANLTVDGIFGRGTDTAVRSYQRSKGLSVDGIAGANTFASLRGTSGTGGAPVQTAAQKLSAFDATKPQAYQSNYQDQINALLNQIQNRPKFSYDFASDPLYNQYAQRYQQLGKMAMEDTMGQSAALTGGYGNSYAQTAGQQQYNQYMQGLNDVIPELRNSAYQMYSDEGNDMARRLSLYQQQEDADYGRYMDAYNQWQNERNYLYQLAKDEEEKRRWEAEYALSQKQAARASRLSSSPNRNNDYEVEEVSPKYNGYKLGLIQQIKLDMNRGIPFGASFDKHFSAIEKQQNIPSGQKTALKTAVMKYYGMV